MLVVIDAMNPSVRVSFEEEWMDHATPAAGSVVIPRSAWIVTMIDEERPAVRVAIPLPETVCVATRVVSVDGSGTRLFVIVVEIDALKAMTKVSVMLHCVALFQVREMECTQESPGCDKSAFSGVVCSLNPPTKFAVLPELVKLGVTYLSTVQLSSYLLC